MTVYRVGSEGATVFDALGREVLRLPPGTVIVPGTTETTGSSAQQYAELERKRIAGYSDKRLKPPEDKRGSQSR